MVRRAREQEGAAREASKGSLLEQRIANAFRRVRGRAMLSQLSRRLWR